jgi:hypothetical protein
VSFQTRYVIVAGAAWIRRTRVETTDGRIDDRVWAVLFGDGEPSVHMGPAGASSIERGAIGGLSWELDWTSLQPDFETPRGVLRRVAPTRLDTSPAILVSGRIGDRELDAAPGHTARLNGTRHAASWGWAHWSDADGRFVHVLTAKSPPLPRVSQHATERGGPGVPIARAHVAPPRFTVGPYTLEAAPETFVRLEYLDTDGSSLWCYHSENGRLTGGGLALDGVAMELGTRTPIDGWPT